MYIKEAHILIQQGLQDIGVFANSDALPEEVDIRINDEIWNVLEEDFKPLNKPQGFSSIQGNLDKYKDLLEKDVLLEVVKQDENYVATLPENYYHLVKDKSVVLYECTTCNVTSGNLLVGEWYIVKGFPITYNGTLRNKGDIFKCIEASTTYTNIATNEKIIVNHLNRRNVPNRLTEEANIEEINRNALTKTNAKSPLSTLAGSKLFIKAVGFFIEKAYISFIRKPNRAYSDFTKYNNSSTLIVGKEYEVVKGQVTYNSNIYKVNPGFQLDSFIVVTGHTTITGTGEIRIKGEGDIELPMQVALDVVKKVTLKLAAFAQQNQQKIVNIAQT